MKSVKSMLLAVYVLMSAGTEYYRLAIPEDRELIQEEEGSLR